LQDWNPISISMVIAAIRLPLIIGFITWLFLD
jgi:hypothetical protein